MLKVFFLLFLLIPLIELYVLIQVGSVIGALPTILLTVTTAIVGVALMRSQGVATMQNAQASMAVGEVPQLALMEGVFIFLGGVLLFIPGLISDAIGLLFLIPFVRRGLIRQSLKGYQAKGHFRYQNSQGDYFEGEWSESNPKPHEKLQHHSVIEGEVEDKDRR